MLRREARDRHVDRLLHTEREARVEYYILVYELDIGYLDRRTEFREEHLGLAREAHARGELLLAGAVADPADHAYLVFRVPSAGIVEAFARGDPYVTNGLVKRWE